MCSGMSVFGMKSHKNERKLLSDTVVPLSPLKLSLLLQKQPIVYLISSREGKNSAY
jgi:hypothetical protein